MPPHGFAFCIDLDNHLPMQLIALAKNPIPGGAIVGELKGAGGVRLRFARWSHTRGARRGTVCLFQGRGEFIEKYFEVIADLRRRGFAVATLDWRGQGGSERLVGHPRKGHVGSFSEFDADLRIFMRDVVLPDCPPPFIALAHSMGGNILLRNVAKPGSWFDRMVLTAPMVYVSEERAKHSQRVTRLVSELACLAGASKSYIPGGSDIAQEELPFEGNPLTSDRERWARSQAILTAAPQLGLGSPTFGWVRSAYRSMALVQDPRFPGRVEVPILVFAAGRDVIVPSRRVEDFGYSLKVGTTILLPQAQHEIMQDADQSRSRFWASFDAYLGIDNTRLGVAS